MFIIIKKAYKDDVWYADKIGLVFRVTLEVQQDYLVEINGVSHAGAVLKTDCAIACSSCGGLGRVDDYTCPTCNGSGEQQERQ